MLIVGTADDITPDAVSVRMAGEIEVSWLVRFKCIPHVGSSHAPEEYGRTVVTFLGTDESRPETFLFFALDRPPVPAMNELIF